MVRAISVIAQACLASYTQAQLTAGEEERAWLPVFAHAPKSSALPDKREDFLRH